MPDISILDSSAVPVPKAYTIAGSQEIVLKGVTASFDGTAAAGSFVPAVQIVDPSGHVVGTYTAGTTLTAGASADVSWFPGVTPSAGGDGIKFDTNPQAGDWLRVEATGSGPGFHGVYFLTDTADFTVNSQGGLFLDESSGAGIAVTGEGAGNTMLLQLSDTNSGLLKIQQEGNGGMLLENDGSGDTNIFHNAEGGILQLLGTAASDPNPRVTITNTSSVTGDTMFVGNDNSQIKFAHGASGSHISVLGGIVSSAGTMSENVSLRGDASDAGEATHYNNTSVAITPTLLMHTTDTEPTGTIVGSDSEALVLYVYNDGSGHPKLKVWCPANSTRATLATL